VIIASEAIQEATRDHRVDVGVADFDLIAPTAIWQPSHPNRAGSHIFRSAHCSWRRQLGNLNSVTNRVFKSAKSYSLVFLIIHDFARQQQAPTQMG
jgi:hypothetical protein